MNEDLKNHELVKLFARALDRYANNAPLFVREVIGVEPDVWQIEFLQAISDGERKISVRSGHGVGKSTAASWAMIWFVLCRYPVKVVVTAPTTSQLYDALFAELKMPACIYTSLSSLQVSSSTHEARIKMKKYMNKWLIFIKLTVFRNKKIF